MDLALCNGRAAISGVFSNNSLSAFRKQVSLIYNIGKFFYGFDYQYRELIMFHARCDLRGKLLVEIGGSLPNDLLFEHLGVEGYTNIESPDYIEADSGLAFSCNHCDHERRTTIYCNAEDIDQHLQPASADAIFSVACFEHIYDLPKASSACHSITRGGGRLFSYFAPIYSNIDEGDHGVIPLHHKLSKKPIGFYLLSNTDQRNRLLEAGIISPQEIQDFLGHVNFNRIPNRLLYEDYEQICTESPYSVLQLNRQEDLIVSKRFPGEIEDVRRSNPKVRNIMSTGFRIHLIKVTS